MDSGPAVFADGAFVTTDALRRLNFSFGRRVPMVFQTEAAECGLACVAMVAGYHGHHIDLAELRRRFGASTKGARLSDLVKISNGMAMASRALRLDMHELHMLRLPCILHWDLNHFVVLRTVTGTTVTIHDPAVGIRRLRMKDVSRHFTGVALELTVAPGFAARPSRPPMRLLDALGRVTGLRRSMALVFVMALAIEVLGITIPFYMQLTIDQALLSADRTLLTTLALGFSLVIVTQVAIRSMRGWALMVLSTSLKLQGKTNLFTHLQRLPTRYFESRHLADIMSRFDSLTQIQQAMTADLIEGVLDGLFAVLTIIIMAMISPQLTLIVLAGGALYAALRLALYRPLREASLEGILWAAKRDSHFLETLRGIRTIKLMNGQERRRARWLNLMVETVNRELTVEKLRIILKAGNGLVLGLLTVIVVWLAAVKVLDNVFSVGMLVAFVAYKTQFLARISALIDLVVDIRMMRIHGERLADIALATPEADDFHPAPETPIHPSIELRDLKFRYSEHDAWVLDGIDLHIAAGESVAIVGPSGCGKTTLLKILASLLGPTSGEMLVGGEPILHHGLVNYRRSIGVVLQDDNLLAGSITENISYFSVAPDRTRVEKCARAAGVHDEIIMMPMGYESLIGDMGTSLSGGQKQRVLLARALYRRPRILLLDEATSHLDIERERHVNDALKSLRITRIIVAHRPETIRSADRVIALRDGRVDHFADDAIDMKTIETGLARRMHEIAGGRTIEKVRRLMQNPDSLTRPRRPDR